MFIFSRPSARAAAWILSIRLAILPHSAWAVEPFGMKDLTDDQRAILFHELEKYAVVTAGLNYCERPPFLQNRIRSVATGCVEAQSLDMIEERFDNEVKKWSGRTDCSDKKLQIIMDRATQKMRWLVDDIKTACKLRIFYKIRSF
jgi:hypothetical protein